MSVSVVQFRTGGRELGRELGFEAWCDECGSVAELTVPLSAYDDAFETARADVERAALLHEDNDHAPIVWVDDEPLVASARLADPGREEAKSARPPAGGPSRLGGHAESQNGDPPSIRAHTSKINELEHHEMNESQELGPERVAVTLADVVAWATEFADDPAWRLPDLIAELDPGAKDQAIGQLFRLVYYALLKPSQLSDSEYLERIVLLSRDLTAPLEGDVWSGAKP